MTDMRRGEEEDRRLLWNVSSSGQNSTISFVRAWPRLRGQRSKGTSEGNELGYRARTHTHTHKPTHKHVWEYLWECLSSSALTHNSNSCAGHLYISSLISILVLFVLLILSVMLTSSYERTSCQFPKKIFYGLFPKQTIEKEFEPQDAWTRFWVAWNRT